MFVTLRLDRRTIFILLSRQKGKWCLLLQASYEFYGDDSQKKKMERKFGEKNISPILDSRCVVSPSFVPMYPRNIPCKVEVSGDPLGAKQPLFPRSFHQIPPWLFKPSFHRESEPLSTLSNVSFWTSWQLALGSTTYEYNGLGMQTRESKWFHPFFSKETGIS